MCGSIGHVHSHQYYDASQAAQLALEEYGPLMPHYRQLWESTPDGQSLMALVNGDIGWLMYVRAPGDPGFSSRNPAYSGPPDALINYVLTNGQLDEYPAAWALPVTVIGRALAYFRDHHRPPPWVTWHNDSGDGTSI